MVSGSTWWNVSKEAMWEAIKEVGEKLCNPYWEYTKYVAFGFVKLLPKDDIWLMSEKFDFHGRRIFLMECNGKCHKMILDMEEKLKIKFDRIDNETMNALVKKLPLPYCYEDGTFPEYEPTYIEPEPVDSVGFYPESVTFPCPMIADPLAFTCII